MSIKSRPEISIPKTVNNGAVSCTIQEIENKRMMRVNIARASPR